MFCLPQTPRFAINLSRLRIYQLDSQALQYIYNTTGYNFPAAPAVRVATALVAGEGIGWALGSWSSAPITLSLTVFQGPSILGKGR
jgi:hypothetical protein